MFRVCLCVCSFLLISIMMFSCTLRAAIYKAERWPSQTPRTHWWLVLGCPGPRSDRKQTDAFEVAFFKVRC